MSWGVSITTALLALSAARPFACRYDLSIPKVAARLEKAVDAALDQGYRTKDIFNPKVPGTQLVKCSEIGAIVLKAAQA